MFSFHDKNIYWIVPKEKTLILKWLKIKIKKDLVDRKKIRWDDEMVDKLIDLYETRPCLWDIADPTYSKRNVKEKALSEIKEQLGMEITAIKAKWNSLGAQHGSELAKENKTKSGQSTDDLYESSWQYMEMMRFVEQVKKTAQSTSTLKLSELSLSAEVSDTEIDLQDDSLNSSEPLCIFRSS